MISRRTWLAIVGGVELAWLDAARNQDPLRGGKFVALIPFTGEGSLPLDTVEGDELDGRLYTDLARVEDDRLVTPNANFYIRTRASHILDRTRAWSIQAGNSRLPLGSLAAQSVPQGLHLLECAGNVRAAHFGMLSVAAWDGVPLAPLLDRMGFDRRARILVDGFDVYSAAPRTASIPGASWIFTRADLEAAHAFLALRMNGQPLPPDHGAPVRLVVPGWYGCTAIKWVDRIAAVDDQAEATSQMREYAARTHQTGIPARAADYQPAVIDPAAMPVRVEKWLVEGRARYRVIGLVWGGAAPARRLEIRFRPEDPYLPVEQIEPAPRSPWGLWRHMWTPAAPGLYEIRLRVADVSVRTRRLDAGFYARLVRI